MFINQKAVKDYAHAFDKRVSKSFLSALDYKVRVLIDKSTQASNNEKTITLDDIKHLTIKENLYR